MRRRQLTHAAGAAAALASWGVVPTAHAAALGVDEATAGVRAALERGAASAVRLLGRKDGFLGNPKVRIALPGPLEDAGRLLRSLGQGRRVDELVTAMNRAAEEAVPQARELLVQAVRDMSVEDAVDIVRGGDTSVTDFFARKTRSPLSGRLRPIVTRATERVKLAERYQAFASGVSRLGLVRREDADLPTYVTGKALDGLYLMIGEEERRIRADPVKTGSEILKKVFGR